MAKQWFHPVPDEIVDQVIEKGDIMYCAGGFMIDEPLLFPYLAQREGDEEAILGLSSALLVKLLQQDLMLVVPPTQGILTHMSHSGVLTPI